MDEIDIRESLPGDVSSLEKLYPAAFPDEDLLPIVRALTNGDWEVISLVAISNGALVGHVIFTRCAVAGAAQKVALLAPLAVAPETQRQGIGQTLIRDGFQRLKTAGVATVFVLGDPAYYGRTGFEVEDNVTPPYALPDEWRGAWQSVALTDLGQPLRGKLLPPEPWLRRALWAP